MRLRAVGLILALALLAAPLAAEAQQAGKVARAGLLWGGSHSALAHLLDAFRQGLRERGYVEGQNIAIESRWAEGRYERFPDLAAELVRLQVDVIVAPITPAALAAKKATGTVPIVIVLPFDPVASGLVPSLARPGGNVTGLTSSTGTEIVGKYLQLLREAVPRTSRVAVLWNPAQPSHPLVQRSVSSFGMRPVADHPRGEQLNPDERHQAPA